jgi:hypothetical protein
MKNKKRRPTIDPRIPQHLVPLAATGNLRILDPQYEYAAVACVSEEQVHPLLCERGLCGRVRLLAVARFQRGRRRMWDGMPCECLVRN